MTDERERQELEDTVVEQAEKIVELEKLIPYAEAMKAFLRSDDAWDKYNNAVYSAKSRGEPGRSQQNLQEVWLKADDLWSKQQKIISKMWTEGGREDDAKRSKEGLRSKAD